MRAAPSRILQELAPVIGEAAALDLAWAFRGTILYVPKDPANRPQIAEAIGAEAAARLCDVFWDTSIYMPATEATEHKVRAMAAAGHSRRAIALALGIGERRVYRILDRPERDSGAGDSRQGSLFASSMTPDI